MVTVPHKMVRVERMSDYRSVGGVIVYMWTEITQMCACGHICIHICVCEVCRQRISRSRSVCCGCKIVIFHILFVVDGNSVNYTLTRPQ